MSAISNAEILFAIIVVCRVILIALLVRIAISDLKNQKILNNDLVMVAVLAVCVLAADLLVGKEWLELTIALLASALLFVILFIFWMFGKLGAGDVKMMAIVPLITGGEFLLPFSILLLIFLFVILMFIKFPMMLPEFLFEKYIKVLDRKGVVPFGVPISAALIGVILLQSANIF